MRALSTLAAILILCSTSVVGAEKTVVIWADADTMVVDEPDDVPQGDRTRVDVSHGPATPFGLAQIRRQALFRFPIDPIPAGSTIVWASFEFPMIFSDSRHIDTGAPLGEPIVQLACAPLVWDEQTTWSDTGEIQANWVSVSIAIAARTEFDDEMTRQIVSGWVNGIPNDGIVVSSWETPVNVDLWSCSSRETGIGGAPVLWVRYIEPAGGGPE